MGFKKTEKGNLIYEFDFTPTKLLPVKPGADLNGKYGCALPPVKMSNLVLVQLSNGTIPPLGIQIRSCGEEYGFLLVFPLQGTLDDGAEYAITANLPVVATAIKRFFYPQNGEECDIEKLWDANSTIPVLSTDAATSFMEKMGFPCDGYQNLRERMS